VLSTFVNFDEALILHHLRAYVASAMSLSSLPTELVECIATHLDLSGSCSLRLASSSLRQQSLHVFRDRFFRTRSVSWTKHDLDLLGQVSAHADFGLALQHVFINATPLHSVLLWQLRKRISESDAISSEPNGVFFKSELQEQYIEEEKTAKELATFFNETHYDQKCLRLVFEKVRHLESIMFGYEGMDKEYGKFRLGYCQSSQHEMSRPFVSTMAAIAASGIHVNEISVHPKHHYGAVSIGRLESLAPSLRNFDAVFENLERLELNLRDWRYPSTGFELEETRAPFVVRFLAKARNVKYLSLSCYSGLSDDLLGELARHCTFTKLEVCTLSHFRLLDASDLCSLLAPSFFTLKGLSLSHVELHDQSRGWMDLLRDLAASEDTLQALQWMMLSNMFTNTMPVLYFDISESSTLWVGIHGDTGSWRKELLAHTARYVGGPRWYPSVTAYPFIGLS
jgi:hypothetical protein